MISLQEDKKSTADKIPTEDSDKDRDKYLKEQTDMTEQSDKLASQTAKLIATQSCSHHSKTKALKVHTYNGGP